jgi:hypothetical protein
MKKKILQEQDIKIGMKLYHSFTVAELTVVAEKPIAENEIWVESAKLEAKGGYIYQILDGSLPKPFFKL